MLRFAPIFADHMVLQRDVTVPVWGEGAENERVIVEIDGTFAEAVVKDGKWCAWLPPLHAATGLVLKASCRFHQCIVHDVAVGEVWITGGQSNMEFPLQFDAEGKTTIEEANDPDLRFFDVPKICYPDQSKNEGVEYDVCWRPFSPEHAGRFTAAGAYFALQLRKSLRVPVGIVGCNWGGTSASAWMSESYLTERPELAPYLENYEQHVKMLDMEDYRRKFTRKRMLERTPEALRIHEALLAGLGAPGLPTEFVSKISDEQLELLSLPVGPWDPRRPCGLYETMLKTIVPFAVQGVIWYQGESDEVLPKQYAVLFTQLIRCWRDAWNKELPFLFVQLAPFRRWLSNTGDQFPELRRQQELVSKSVPCVWMASIMDAGDEFDIHPKRKRPVGERLALLARGKVYGEDLLCEPPEPLEAKWDADRLIIRFAHAGDGLRCNGSKPEGLQLILDGERYDFEAELHGDTLILRAPAIGHSKTAKLAYAWVDYVQADLYNSADLCAKPFRMELRKSR